MSKKSSISKIYLWEILLTVIVMGLIPFFFQWYYVVFPFLGGLLLLILTKLFQCPELGDDIDVEKIRKRVTKR